MGGAFFSFIKNELLQRSRAGEHLNNTRLADEQTLAGILSAPRSDLLGLGNTTSGVFNINSMDF